MIPLKEILAHAESTWPAECCGLILAAKDGALRFQPIKNVAGEGTQTSRRTQRDGYVMDPEALLAALSTVESEGGSLWAIVHSHPEVGAYFSAEDKEMALGGGDEPLWPGVHYLVVSVRQGRADDARLYTWDALRKDFAEKQIAVTTSVLPE